MKYLNEEDAKIIAEFVKDDTRLKTFCHLAGECAEAGKKAGDNRKRLQLELGKINKFINDNK